MPVDHATILIDGRCLSDMTEAEKDALIISLAQERDAMATLMPAVTHGGARVRSFIDPQRKFVKQKTEADHL